MRKAGDRQDISSDEEDELEAARRNWPRTPLSGAALAIARMWLGKARKRRAFVKLIRGIIDQNKRTTCEVCGRTPEKNNVKLVAHLATDGEPDIRAIDRLIAGFEEQYGMNELDPTLWKAYFRAHAEYCTRCSICEDASAQEQLVQASREPGPTRPTRPEDISSDEEDDDMEFEPIVVSRSSPVGRMMSKWLVAARKKIGGQFPRPDARKQMNKYMEKLRQQKLKKSKKPSKEDQAKVPGAMEQDQLRFSAATTALAQRWIRMARESLDSKFRLKSGNLKDETDRVLDQMPEEDDWYFGAALRLEGKDLLRKGASLEADRRTLEAEAALKIHKIQSDIDNYVKERSTEIDRERKAFETKLAQKRDRVALDIELRNAELEKTKEIKKREFTQIERTAKEEMGAAPTELVQSHRAQLQAIDNQMFVEQKAAEKKREEEERDARTMFQRTEDIKIAEVERRKAAASGNATRIREELAAKVKAAEAEWQAQTAKWLLVARRKVQVKKKEDDDAKQVKKKRGGR
jgi:hypothetical protein